tara:strand:+ start:898 stop:1503 length:606 start_codon:yes stop_codon:yes gene_type:complete
MSYKPFFIGLATVFGVAHLGILGHLIQAANRPATVLPSINIPTGPYSSYNVEVGKEGYRVRYNANDPKVLRNRRALDLDKTVQKEGGFFTKGSFVDERRREYDVNEYTMDGYLNTGGGELSGGKPGGLSAERTACIKAEGSGESTGAMVGASVASGFAPVLTGIPYVGWLASGWAVMLGQQKGGEVGGTIAKAVKGCDDAS